MDHDGLRCVLAHWYEHGGADKPSKARFQAIKDLHVLIKHQGEPPLLEEIGKAAEGKIVPRPAYLIVGSGLFPEDVRAETLVRRYLDHPLPELRLEAIYAAVFFISRSEEIALSVSTILIQGDPAVCGAASVAFRLTQMRPCSTCSLYISDSWCPSKASFGVAGGVGRRYDKRPGDPPGRSS